MSEDRIEVRSFRTVFELERRIYRVDRLRLNPGGIPMRAVIYFAIAALVILALARLPLLGALVQALPWYLRDGGLAAAIAAVLAVVRVDGRPFHLAALALARHARRPRHLSAFAACPPLGTRWRPPDVLLVPDGSEPAMRRLRYRGPGAVMVRAAHSRRLRRRRLGRPVGRLELVPARRAATPSRAQVIAVASRGVVDVLGPRSAEITQRGKRGSHQPRPAATGRQR